MGTIPALELSEMLLEKAVQQVLHELEKDAEIGVIVLTESAGYRHTISALPVILST